MPGQSSRLQKAKLSHVQNNKFLHSLCFEDNCMETCSSWLLYLCNSWESMSNLPCFLSVQHSKSLSHTLKSFPTWTIKRPCCSSEYFLMELLAHLILSRIELFVDTVVFLFCLMEWDMFSLLRIDFLYISIHIYMCNYTYLYSIGVCMHIYICCITKYLQDNIVMEEFKVYMCLHKVYTCIPICTVNVCHLSYLYVCMWLLIYSFLFI